MDSPTDPYVQCTHDDLTKEMWRRIWWECWALEMFLFAVPGMEPDVVVLNHESSRPNLPRWSSTNASPENQASILHAHTVIISSSLTPNYQDNSDALYMQSMGLLYQVVRTFNQPIDLEQLSQLSNMGASIYALARQNWAAASSYVPTTNLIPQDSDIMSVTSRERSHFASLIAASAVIYLHLNQVSAMVPDVDGLFDPLPGTPRYLSDVCRMVYKSLGDAFNFYSSMSMLSPCSTLAGFSSNRPLNYSPLFSTLLKFTAIGSFLALTRSPALQSPDENAQMTRAAMIVDLQLAETTIAKQAMRWRKSKVMIQEINNLRRKMQESITSTTARAIIGA